MSENKFELKKKISGEKIFSLSCGILLIKGIPAAAVLAGWELSSLIGADIGDILAAVIFLLGVSAVNISVQIGDKRLTETGRCIISLIYIIVSSALNHTKSNAENNYIITSAAGIIDCVIMLLIINKTGKRGYYFFTKIILLTAFSILTVFYNSLNFKPEIMHPLLASLLTGTALVRITAAESDINLSWLFVGMAGTILFDAMF